MGTEDLLTTATEERPASSASADDVVLEVEGVAKRYGTEDVIPDLSLAVRDGEILTLLGPRAVARPRRSD